MLLDEKGFIQTVKELAYYLSLHSTRFVDSEYLGDWKAVKNHIGNGEVQATLYREVSQIIITYSHITEENIEMLVEITPSFDDFLHQVLLKYVKSTDCYKYKEEKGKVIMVQFKGVSEFFVFVDYYLREYAEKHIREE